MGKVYSYFFCSDFLVSIFEMEIPKACTQMNRASAKRYN